MKSQIIALSSFFALAPIYTHGQNPWPSRVTIDVDSFTTSRCDCDAPEKACHPSLEINHGCKGNCGNMEAWCDLRAHICVEEREGNVETDCPTTIYDKYECGLLNNFTKIKKDSII
eukprot:Awhi_evm1s5376